MKRITALHFIVLVLLSFLFFPGCTGDKPADTSDEEPIIVRSRLRSNPDKLNPILTTKSHSLQIVNMIFPSLLNYDPTTNELSPMLAKARPEMELITEGPYKGGAAYTYEILDEAVWDNGKPVLASDYLFTLKALFTPKIGADAYQGLLIFIRDFKIDPDNPKRFTVYTDRTFRSEPGSGFYVYPEHAYDSTGIMRKFAFTDLTDPEKRDALADNPDIIAFRTAFNTYGSNDETLIESCGAYRVVEWEHDRHVIIEKKENWWGDKLVDQYPLLAAYPDEIIFKVMKDNVAAITAMKDGQLDIIADLPTPAYKEFQQSEAAKDINFHAAERMAYMYVGMNSRRPFLNDKRVRRALAHLTDVDEIIETVQQGMAVPSISPYPANASYNNKSLPRILFDVEKAKSLLQEAGWKDSDGDGIVDKVIDGKKTDMTIGVTITSSEVSTNILAIITEDAKKAGVNYTPNIVTAQVLFGEVLPTRNFDAYMLASIFDLDLYDPGQLWHTSSDTPSGGNRVGFGDSKSDAIIDEIRTTTDEAHRKDLYFELQDIIYEEQPIIFLYKPLHRIVIHKKFKHATTTLRSPGYLENTFH